MPLTYKWKLTLRASDGRCLFGAPTRHATLLGHTRMCTECTTCARPATSGAIRCTVLPSLRGYWLGGYPSTLPAAGPVYPARSRRLAIQAATAAPAGDTRGWWVCERVTLACALAPPSCGAARENKPPPQGGGCSQSAA
eukprot:641158-Pleurochrysis_carterae.AAC.3